MQRGISSRPVRSPTHRRALGLAAWMVVGAIAEGLPCIDPVYAASSRLQEPTGSPAGGETSWSNLAAEVQGQARAGRGAEALAAAARWLAAATTANDREQQALALAARGRLHGAAGLFAEANEAFEAALAHAEGVANPALQLELLVDLAKASTNLLRFSAAADALERADRLAPSVALPRLAFGRLLAWGTLHLYRNDLATAQASYERALEVARRLDDPASLAVVLTNLAQVRRSRHDYAAALLDLDEALSLQATSPQRAITLASMGVCLLELNRPEEAGRRFEQAAEDARQQGRAAIEAWATGELALIEHQEGDSERALRQLDRAIALSRRAGDRRSELAWWLNRGKIRRDQGRFAEALADYRKAEAIQDSTAGLAPTPNLYKHLGQAHAGLGDVAAAHRLFERALELAVAARDTKVIWETHRERARLDRANGRPADAVASYRASLAAIEELRGSLRLDTLKSDFFRDKVHVYEELIDLLTDAATPVADPRAAFAVAERARARAFLDTLAEARAEIDATLPAAVLAEERTILDEISRLQGGAGPGGDHPDREAALRAAEERLQALQLRARGEHPRFGALRHPSPAGLEDVQAALAEDELLLEVALGDRTSHLFVVGADRFAHAALPPRAAIETMVRSAYGELLDPHAGAAAFDELGALLLGPLAGHLAGARSLLIVPSGLLHYFPFETLPVAGRPLLEVVATSYLPSASALLELRARHRPQHPARLLAIGDPSASSSPGPAWSEPRQGLGALPHARREVEALGDLFGRRADLLVGEAVSEAAFKALDLRRYSVLHLAVHGWLDPSSASRSGLLLGTRPGDGEDGLLQVREIFRLPLAADLVTLSACRSGLGELVTGEGMVGLTRAAFFAGADAVVASLWNVSDEASAALMPMFYRQLAAGHPQRQALRLARLALRRDPRFRHPHHWAAWVLLGGGERTVAIAAPFAARGWLPLLALALAAALLVGHRSAT